MIRATRRQVILGSAATLLGAGLGRAGLAQTTSLPSYSPGLSDAQLDEISARANAELRAKNEANDARWGIGDWSADLERGTLSFATRDGGRIQAEVQVIGTYVAARRSWMWAWDHPSVPAPRAVHARLVRQFAQAQGLEAMLQRTMEIDQEEAWGFTGLAAHLAGAAGAYRGPAGGTFVFMTHGPLRPA